MKKMLLKQKFLMLLLGCLIPLGVSAQQVNVTGRVTDSANGEPVPGVTIVIAGTPTGTITSIDGTYSINANVGDMLQFSFIGYDTERRNVSADAAVLNVVMQPSVFGVDEVVVIGYGQIRKSDATGSVNVIGADDFNRGPITTPQGLITGRIPGVMVTQGSGAPGSGSTIRIRGGSSLSASNDPLIVIDGFPVDNSGVEGLANPLSTINPNDIESMTVLKDASATAIYGSRASNGVIIITTKRGTKDGLNINYTGNVSVGQLVKYHDVFDGNEFRDLVADRVANHGMDPVALTRLGQANTDWQDEIYRTAVSTDHNVSFYGRYNDIPFRASIGHTIENGILKESSLSRTTLAVTANPSFFDDQLRVTINLKGMDIHNNFSNQDAISSAFQFDPSQPIRNDNTRYGGYFTWIELAQADQLNGNPINIATHNPLARLAYRDDQSDVQSAIGNIQFDYAVPFLEGLRANLNMGMEISEGEGNNNTDPRASWSLREPSFNVQSYRGTRKNQLLDFYLNYMAEVGDHRFDATAGYGWQYFYRSGSSRNRSWEMGDDGEYIGAGSRSYKNENYLVSFFGRLNYAFMDRYLVTATLRNDGSSRFGKDNRWGLFPAFALAWKINEESFLENADFLSELKLRLGYGVTGQQDIGTNYYPYIPIYRESEQGAYYRFGDTYYSTLRPNPYDANLKWEETTTYNLGLDFGFLNNRFQGSVDVYHRETVDLISNVPIAAGTNFSNYLTTNVGSLENQGVEIGLTYRAISRLDLSWSIGANFAANRNEITSLSNLDTEDAGVGYPLGGISGGTGNTVMWNRVGQAANTFFLFQQVYDTNGMPIEGLYVDKTGEGGNVAGNNDNKYFMGTPTPDFLIGISSDLKYRNWDFSFAGRLSIGNEVYNNNWSDRAIYQELYNQSGYLSNIPKAVQRTNFTNAQYWSSVYLEDASFFRMDHITLGYSFERLLTERLSGRVTASVQNAFVITDYSGLDPEVSGGIDNNIYPRPRTFMLGVNVNF
ncbi:SusC/RagA family TonB-linked outer membrane protein [Natronoflexus pectinivorans]|uniref:Iron complex outermembrane receptor protein n=1 Tax=Natronoflexus pectinivorans TaxID=682526 RepID=A0A4R2GL38_9BACT|nr:TonB-dependent receptor [Natronoflexus pectinivorans]TCO09692.1 iron complex outermembrane receptor protein [Natronoflexus pectinivorans]